ncbi:Adenosylmethionine-8-amino-7-oxononanoate aminotransferase OS=Castellaniella defragrans (strain DSM / CCUG 39792 / 65Phen) OX=1437824 GN=bioA PE=3 SV=1 [Castellaniella denitrificans]
MHGPTYMGNALACAAALSPPLDLFESEPRLAQVRAIEGLLRDGLAPCGALPGVRDVRVKGAIGAVELDRAPDRAALCGKFLEAGAWIRPLGNVVYLTPAFTMPPEELRRLTDAIFAVLAARPA